MLIGCTNTYLVRKHPFLFPRSFYRGFENQRGGQVSGDTWHGSMSLTDVGIVTHSELKSSGVVVAYGL